MLFPGCPMCWAAGAALVAPGVAVPAALAIRRDCAIWFLVFILIGTGLAQRQGSLHVFLPWWWYLTLAAVLYARVFYLLYLAIRKRRQERTAETIRNAALG